MDASVPVKEPPVPIE